MSRINEIGRIIPNSNLDEIGISNAGIIKSSHIGRLIFYVNWIDSLYSDIKLLVAKEKINLSKIIKSKIGIISSTISSLSQFFRKVSSNIGISLIVEKIEEFLRELISLLGLLAGIKKIFGYFKELKNSIELTLETLYIGLEEYLVSAIGLTSSAISRFFQIQRKIINSISIDLIKEPAISIAKMFYTAIGLISNISKVFNVTRSFISASISFIVDIATTYISSGAEEFFETLESFMGLISIKGSLAIEKFIMSPIDLTISSIKRLIKSGRVFSSSLNISLIQESIIEFFKELISSLGIIVSLSIQKYFNKRYLSLEGLTSSFKPSIEILRYIASVMGLLSRKTIGIGKKSISTIDLIVSLMKQFLIKKIISSSIGLLSISISLLRTLNRKIYTAIKIDLIKEEITKFFREISSLLGLLSIIKIKKIFIRQIFSIIETLSNISKKSFYVKIQENLLLLNIVSISTLRKFFRNIYSSIGNVSIPDRVIKGARKISSYISFTSNLTRQLSSFKNILLNISIDLFLGKLSEFIRKIYAYMSIDLIKESIGKFFREISALLSLYGIFNLKKSVLRQISTIAGLLPNLSRIVFYKRINKTLLGLSLISLGTLKKFFKNITISTAIVSIIDRSLAIFREIFSSLLKTVIFFRQLSMFRKFESIINVDLLSEKLLEFFRNFYAVLNIDSIMERTISVSTKISSLFGINSFIDTLYDAYRKISTNIAIASILSKFAQFIRKISNNIDLLVSQIIRLFELIGYKSIKFIRDIYKISFDRAYKSINFWRRIDK